MPGKAPKERERYFIRLDKGEICEVNRDVYLCWYAAERQDRYQRERDIRHGLVSLEEMAERRYYGEGDNDYNMGPCTSCDEKGYIIVKPSGNSGGGKKVVCGSCEEYVKEVITKKDAAGENRTWCSDCWEEYDSIMGR